MEEEDCAVVVETEEDVGVLVEQMEEDRLALFCCWMIVVVEAKLIKEEGRRSTVNTASRRLRPSAQFL